MITAATIDRAADKAAIAPLIDMCKTGRLLDAQAWIAAGKPVNGPPFPAKGTRPKTPLEVAIDHGFHSLVQVLLEAGAIQEPTGYGCPMYQALGKRRFDIIPLLVKHGFDPKTMDIGHAFHTWDPKIIEYFIAQGADLRKGRPFAHAFCSKIRTTLKFYKQQRANLPELQDQADIALRYHCKEGNLKWVSLMLWAGADPWKPGPDSPGAGEYEEVEGLSALGYAALYNHYEVLTLKPIRSKLGDPRAAKVMAYLVEGGGLDILQRILEAGVSPNEGPEGGCLALQSCIGRMTWEFGTHAHGWDFGLNRKLDTDRSRDCMKTIHLLAKRGARWVPADEHSMRDARRSFLKMIPDYLLEFVWVMSKYRACKKESVVFLTNASSIKVHLGERIGRLKEILDSWQE